MPTNKEFAEWILRGSPAGMYHPETVVYSEMAVRAAIIRALKSRLTPLPPDAAGDEQSGEQEQDAAQVKPVR